VCGFEAQKVLKMWFLFFSVVVVAVAVGVVTESMFEGE
jgi:hypothetical protein